MAGLSGDGGRPVPAPAVRDHVDGHLEGWVEELAAWTAVPSVSAVPEHASDLDDSARFLTERLREAGFPEVDVWTTAGAPAVHARWPARDPDAPTLLVYGHHDVRAVVPEHWRITAPFSPLRRGDRLYGRGASDAKAQLLCHVWALRTHLAVTGRTAPDFTLLLVVDGEEEIGSPHLADLLGRHAGRLRPDAIVLSDTMLWSLDDAAVCTGVRGAVSAHLEIRGADHDVHSGLVAGAAPDPSAELCRVLGHLHDERGRVAVPHFYDDVRPPTAARRAELASVPFDTEDWLRRTGCRGVRGEAGWSVLERLWSRPAAEIAVLHGGEPGLPSRGVMPAVAAADIGLRLVPDQSADRAVDQLRQWVGEQVSPDFAWRLTSPPINADPYSTPAGHPVLAALDRAVSRTVGRPAVHIGNGGSAPAALLAQALHAPVVFYGTGLPEDRWHDADEKVELRALRQGVETLAYFYDDLPRALGRPPAHAAA
ncbi:M20/M25/M40 family metallo-hydrolase [Kitasatospora terrestris]|uniref:Dipeptidase n=1 Tax=Kitasatospora terrestris TaxID=258051 RepID=A0ABP9EN38_9ACTN